MATGSSVTGKLAGRKLWIPRMTYISARMMAAVFRSIGIDASMTPPSDEETLELGGFYTSGEECYPEKITLGDFLKIVNADDFDPAKTAFFMPTAEGPCRFGQYAPYLRQVLDSMGHDGIPIISPTSKNSYDGVGEHAPQLFRSMWRGLVAADILRKLLLKTRPYETNAGSSDEAYETGVELLEQVLEARGDMTMGQRLKAIIGVVVEARDVFRAVPAKYTKDRPLIGVVGEIFCRLNTFSNGDAVRKIESHGGEVWLSDVGEWVWYTNWSQKTMIRRERGSLSLQMLGALVKNSLQRREEQKLLAPCVEDFVGYEEPHDIETEVLDPGEPYLPAEGALGEMALSIGKSCYLHGKGADGIIDISPFSCMNGIVSESVYHALSSDHDDMPIRNFYFDATSSNMDRDLDIFMELALSYQKRKKVQRRYPACFEN